jgi:hypothetical protein
MDATLVNPRIVYMDPNTNTMVMLVPSPFCGLTLDQIAAKDVPAGVPYLVVDVSDIPTTSEFQHAWEADFSQPHGVGANYGAGTNIDVAGWNLDGTPILRTLP